MTDRDLHELRAFRSGLDEPPPDLLERVTNRTLVTTGTRPAARPRYRVLLVPAAALAALAVIVGATVLTAAGDRGKAPSGSGTSGTSASPAPSVTASPSPDAREVIGHLADLAGARPAPAPLRPGQVVSVNYSSGSQQVPESTWDIRLDPQGMIFLSKKLLAGCCPPTAKEKQLDQESAAAARDLLAHSPTLCSTPTPASMNAQATDLTSLRQAIDRCGKSYEVENRSIVYRLSQFFEYTDALAPRRLNAGLLRLLAAQPHPQASQVTLKGKRYWAVTDMAGEPERGELLVDPATGRVAGYHEVTSVDYVAPTPTAALSRRTRAVPVEPYETYWWLWSSRLVPQG